MYDLIYYGYAITGLFNWLSSLSWPIFIFIIVWLFRHQIARLIANLKSASVFGVNVNFKDDQVSFPLEDKTVKSFKLQPLPPTEKVPATKVQRLSDEQIEESKQKALKRLEEDTKRVGYKRGKLYQLENGKWGISWELQVSDGIIVKDS